MNLRIQSKDCFGELPADVKKLLIQAEEKVQPFLDAKNSSFLVITFTRKPKAA